MDRISCDMCMDLMPLVNDGVACEDTRLAVEGHVQECENCRMLFEKKAMPKVDTEQALSKAAKRVRRFAAVAAVVFVIMGICLCELIFGGSSVFFVIAVLLIRQLLFVTIEGGKGWKNYLKRGIAGILALVLVCGIVVLANVILGNPISKKMAQKAAENYLAGKFPDEDYIIEEIDYDSVRAHYEVNVRLQGSADCYFTIDTDRKGNFHHDSYNDVLTGWNTAERIGEAYRQVAEPAALQLNLTYKRAYISCELQFEQRQWQEDPYEYQLLLNGEPLEVDGDYDVLAEGARSGSLRVSVEEEEVSPEKAAEILLEVCRLMDGAEVPFHSIDLTLKYPRTEDPMEQQREGCIMLEGFLYEDIYREGLVERIREASVTEDATEP